jgi:CspA family cold shock protein
MPSGVIKFFHSEKGYGTIGPDDGSRDLFFEQSNILPHNPQLIEGQRVEFEITVGRKGPEAIKIKTIS